MSKMEKFLNKVGIFRLVLLPLGLIIIISAFVNGILGMGIIGGIVLAFGLLNKCLLFGNCEVDIKKNNKK